MRLDRIAMAGIFTAVMGVAAGLAPLTAEATTPPSGAWSVGSPTSGICMEVSGFTSGSKVLLDNCNGLLNQKFYINRAGYYDGTQIAYTLEDTKAGSFQCLNSTTAAGNPINLAACNGIVAAQRFVIVNGNEFFNVATGKCLDSSVVGVQLDENACNASTASQQWFQIANNASPFSN